MIKQTISIKSGFTWLDLSNPTQAELEEVAKKFRLHATSLEDCLNVRHQPKFEEINGIHFMILRVFDEASEVQAEQIRDMTRKLALFVGRDFLITVHRRELPLVGKTLDWWQSHETDAQAKLLPIVIRLVGETVLSYGDAIEQMEIKLDLFESEIFSEGSTKQIIKEIHWFRRKSSAINRILRQSYEVIIQLDTLVQRKTPDYQDVRERIERYMSIADGLKEGANHVLNTHLALTSHRTDEVIRLLTIISVFFLPLTFIVGVYGMNFEHMPELNWPYGYIAAWAVMIGITAAIYFWFKKQGWLK